MWRAFWKQHGHPLSLLEGLARESLGSSAIPTTFVAHEGDRFAGTVSVIASDTESRPLYTPWVAALWVEPAQRRSGIGARLVERAFRHACDCGAGRVYLLAGETRRAFYEARGWEICEADVPDAGMSVLCRERGS